MIIVSSSPIARLTGIWPIISTGSGTAPSASEELKRVLQETVGINVFEPDSYNGTGLGYGQSLALILKPGEQPESSLTFDVCSKETV